MAEKTLRDYMILANADKWTQNIRLLYHGRVEKETGKPVKRVKAWAVNAEDMFPNEINVYAEKDFQIVGIGRTNRMSKRDALHKLEAQIFRQDKYHFITAEGCITKENGGAKATIAGTAYKIDLDVERTRSSDAKSTSIFLQHLNPAEYKVDKDMIIFS